MAGRAARKDRDQTPDPAGVSPSLPVWRVSSASIVACLPTVGPGEGSDSANPLSAHDRRAAPAPAIGGWLLLSVTAMSGVSLLIFKIDREQRNFTTADLVMVVGFLAPILLFMLAIGFLRPIQWEPLAGAICGASAFGCLAVGIYLYRRAPKAP